VVRSADALSLAYVHHLRRALEATAGAGKTITIDTTDLTPAFNSGEWIQGTADAIRFSLYDAYKVANKFTDSGVETMNGVRVVRDGSDDKCKIVYNRDIKIGDLTYNSNASGQCPTIGIGLTKEENGNIIPDASIKIHGGRME
jgi:hypothetical protein